MGRGDDRRKAPLYRRVNTTAHGVRHLHGGDYRASRGKDDRTGRGAMHGTKRRGLDYTPLFRFLLSKAGEDWDKVHSEAVARLDRPEPIFWLVALNPAEAKPWVLVGEKSYYSGLTVDEAGRLTLVDPTWTVERMEPTCACCTHTFNGVPFVRPYSEDRSRIDTTEP